MINKYNITGVILAGGRGRRMAGKDKGLVVWHGKPLVEYAIETIKPHTSQIIISCNRSLSDYQRLGLPLVTDKWPDYRGPLAGLFSIMDSQQCNGNYILLCPCDCPRLNNEIMLSLLETMQSQHLDCIYCHDGERAQYLVALIDVKTKARLADYLASGRRSVQGWYDSIEAAPIEFPQYRHAFQNINSSDHLLDTE